MSMQTYPACGYGLAFTADQVEPLFEKIIAIRHTNDLEDMRPENVYDAIELLNDESYDWFFIDNNGDGNFNATITRIGKPSEDLDDGLLYIPYGATKVPWATSDKTKDEWFADIKTSIGELLPDDYNIEENFVFAQWCQFG